MSYLVSSVVRKGVEVWVKWWVFGSKHHELMDIVQKMKYSYLLAASLKLRSSHGACRGWGVLWDRLKWSLASRKMLERAKAEQVRPPLGFREIRDGFWAPSRDLGTPVEKKERRKEKEREGGKGGRKEKEKERKKDENARQSIMKLMHLLYFICNLIIKKRAENLKGTLA